MAEAPDDLTDEPDTLELTPTRLARALAICIAAAFRGAGRLRVPSRGV
ncbi:hypothetical protein ABIA33_001130 [Streptacidiphilus sp. MAP12-16]